MRAQEAKARPDGLGQHARPSRFGFGGMGGGTGAQTPARRASRAKSGGWGCILLRALPKAHLTPGRASLPPRQRGLTGATGVCGVTVMHGQATNTVTGYRTWNLIRCVGMRFWRALASGIRGSWDCGFAGLSAVLADPCDLLINCSVTHQLDNLFLSREGRSLSQRQDQLNSRKRLSPSDPVTHPPRQRQSMMIHVIRPTAGPARYASAPHLHPPLHHHHRSTSPRRRGLPSPSAGGTRFTAKARRRADLSPPVTTPPLPSRPSPPPRVPATGHRRQHGGTPGHCGRRGGRRRHGRRDGGHATDGRDGLDRRGVRHPASARRRSARHRRGVHRRPGRVLRVVQPIQRADGGVLLLGVWAYTSRRTAGAVYVCGRDHRACARRRLSL